jgi:glyoxylase-like metal-dependent hydrolase (beta-lactamase superfamily II)
MSKLNNNSTDEVDKTVSNVSNISIINITKDILCIRELDYLEHCNCYLIIGSEKCLLIDPGIGLIDFEKDLNLSSLIKDKELYVVITHLHFDHFLGAKLFNKIYANVLSKKQHPNIDIGLSYLIKKDFLNNSFNFINKNFNILDYAFEQILDNHIFDLGNYCFKVIFTPGHDPSSISLFDKEKGILFSGDTIYSGKLLFDFIDSDKKKYLESIALLLSFKPSLILGGHNGPIVIKDY